MRDQILDHILKIDFQRNSTLEKSSIKYWVHFTIAKNSTITHYRGQVAYKSLMLQIGPYKSAKTRTYCEPGEQSHRARASSEARSIELEAAKCLQWQKFLPCSGKNRLFPTMAEQQQMQITDRKNGIKNWWDKKMWKLRF